MQSFQNNTHSNQLEMSKEYPTIDMHHPLTLSPSSPSPCRISSCSICYICALYAIFVRLFNQLSAAILVFLYYFQMTFARQYDLSLNRMEFNLFALEKIKFRCTEKKMELLGIIQYQFLFEFMLCDAHWNLLHWLLLGVMPCAPAFLAVMSAFVLFRLLGAHVMQFSSSYRTKEQFHSVARVQTIRWIC